MAWRAAKGEGRGWRRRLLYALALSGGQQPGLAWAEAASCSPEQRAASFAAGDAAAPPWWGAGLPEDSPSMAERSLAFSLAAAEAAAAAASGATGPSLWGSGLNPGPASLEDTSAAAAEWRAGAAPERARFAALGPSGPPTAAGRRLATSLAEGLACGVCHQLVNALWEDLAEPSLPAIERWLGAGCVPSVRRHLLQLGWHTTVLGCEGVGTRAADGAVWCLRQDPTNEVLRRPHLADEYDPAQDALFLACRRTLGAHAPAVAALLAAQRNGTPARARNEHLARTACVEAACCHAL